MICIYLLLNIPHRAAGDVNPRKEMKMMDMKIIPLLAVASLCFYKDLFSSSFLSLSAIDFKQELSGRHTHKH